MSEQQLKELQARNYQRAQEMKKQLGEKYLLHPANKIQRKK
jgi:hypothetical protein